MITKTEVHREAERAMTERSPLFDDHRLESGLGRRSLRSGAVSIAARVLNAAIQVGSVLVLARLLSPEDYGLVGMVAVLTGFAPVLVSLGTPDVVTQRRSITEGEISALFWLALMIGITCAVLMAACGPLIARFYGEPRLTSLAVVSGLTFMMSALHCQHYALLRRAMRFRELGIIDVAANLLSVVIAVTMAFYGFQYWALVVRPIVMNAFVAAGVWLRCGWLPRWPTTTSEVKEMVKRGLDITGFTMTDFAGKSADRVAIGYSRGPQALGYYQNAMFIYDNLLDVLTAPLHGVAVTSLSKVVGDRKELRRLWSKALVTLEFYAMPAFGILAVTSQDIVVLLLGAKWAVAGSLLSILALRGIPHSVERTLGWLHVAAGRTERWMRWGLAATGIQWIALFCGMPFGLYGVVTAYVISMFVIFIPAIAYAGRPVGIHARDVIQVSWRPLVGSLVAAAIGFALRDTALAQQSAFLRAAALATAYTTVYLAIVVGLFKLRTPVAALMVLARDVLPARVARLVPVPSMDIG
jgi:polysaccharide transporter, PST family